jgi:hypothetical protein
MMKTDERLQVCNSWPTRSGQNFWRKSEKGDWRRPRTRWLGPISTFQYYCLLTRFWFWLYKIFNGSDTVYIFSFTSFWYNISII